MNPGEPNPGTARFEERLLAELRTEVAARAARSGPRHGGAARGRTARGRTAARRRPVGRRLLAGAAISAAAASALIAVPGIIESDGPAYALTANPDGSITVRINDFRDPGQLERDLAARGVRTDITYLPQHKRCAGDIRGTAVDPQPPPGLPIGSRRMKEWIEDHDPSNLAFHWAEPHRDPRVFKIVPRYIKPGWTLVLELAESHRTKLWKLSSYLVSGPVRPCVLENDPTWN